MKQSGHFKLGTDSVLLGNFASATSARHGIDLGCCTGVLSILLLARHPHLHMTGLEIDSDAAAVAQENMHINGFDSRSEIVVGDIRNANRDFQSGSFDVVISNPPYFQLSAGSVSPDIRRAQARGEVSCTLEELIIAAKHLCRWDGKVFLVHKPERLVELLSLMSSNGIEPKRLRFVAHSQDFQPSLVLLEGRRGGNPGLTVEPFLYIKKPDGDDTEEIKKIYHRN